MDRTYTVLLKDKQLQISTKQLSIFSNSIDLNNSYKNRVSELFILDLFVYVTILKLNPLDVIDEIENLENGDGNTQTKPATEFKRPPLQGLWHKHFFCEHFLVQNIQNSLINFNLDALINEIMDPKKSDIITKELISEFSHRVINEPFEGRANSNNLTGEWIVFAKEGGKNYYLCLNTHKAGDQMIADRIKENCTRDFPFLSRYF